MRGLAAEGVLVEDDDGRFGLTEVGQRPRARWPVPRSCAATSTTIPRPAFSTPSWTAELPSSAPTESRSSTTWTIIPRRRQRSAARCPADPSRSRPMSPRPTTSAGCRPSSTSVAAKGPCWPRSCGERRLCAESSWTGTRCWRRLGPVCTRPASPIGPPVSPATSSTTSPRACDGYLLSRVLHDWTDVDAQRILAACRRAVPDHGRLLVVEAVLPDRAVDAPAAVRMDLHMMLLFGSRERTRAELDRAARESGFHRPAHDPDSFAGRAGGHRGDPRSPRLKLAHRRPVGDASGRAPRARFPTPRSGTRFRSRARERAVLAFWRPRSIVPARSALHREDRRVNGRPTRSGRVQSSRKSRLAMVPRRVFSAARLRWPP